MSGSYPPPPAYPLPTRDEVEAALRPALPTQPREYHHFLRTARNRWWKPLLVIPFFLLWFLISTLLGLGAMILDGSLERMMSQPSSGDLMADLVMTPELFLANNLGLAFLIPLSMLAQWAIWGQRPKWLSSVEGGFRWRWFGQFLIITVPLWAVLVGVEFALAPPEGLSWKPYSLLMIVGILLTTPLQSAGEEYFMRGLEQRAVASWIASPKIAWIVATIVSSVTFMSLHLASDIWLNTFYLVFAAAASWTVWKTGGLEAAVAIHVTNNLLAESMMPFSDFSNMFDRSSGTGSPVMLIHMAVLVLATVLIVWRAKKLAVVRETAPGASEVERGMAAAQAQFAAQPATFPQQPPYPTQPQQPWGSTQGQ